MHVKKHCFFNPCSLFLKKSWNYKHFLYVYHAPCTYITTLFTYKLHFFF